MIIDFHNHYYPPEYLDALGPSGSCLKITHDAEGNPVVHYPGDYNVMVRGHRDIAYRQDVLDKDGVDVQVITLTTPGTHVETPAIALRLAMITNDAFARVRNQRPKRFVPLATLPLSEIGVAGTARIKVQKTEPPPGRQRGIMVKDAAELFAELSKRGLV